MATPGLAVPMTAQPDWAAFKRLMEAPSPRKWSRASTFKADGTLWQWACGYKAAAEALAPAVQADRTAVHSACLPLGFLYWHAVELYLKLVLEEAERLGIQTPRKRYTTHDLGILARWVDDIQAQLPYQTEQWTERKAFLHEWNPAMPWGLFLRYPIDNRGEPFDRWGEPVVDYESGRTIEDGGGVGSYQLGYMLDQAERTVRFLDGLATHLHECRENQRQAEEESQA